MPFWGEKDIANGTILFPMDLLAFFAEIIMALSPFSRIMKGIDAHSQYPHLTTRQL